MTFVTPLMFEVPVPAFSVAFTVFPLYALTLPEARSFMIERGAPPSLLNDVCVAGHAENVSLLPS